MELWYPEDERKQDSEVVSKHTVAQIRDFCNLRNVGGDYTDPFTHKSCSAPTIASCVCCLRRSNNLERKRKGEASAAGDHKNKQSVKQFSYKWIFLIESKRVEENRTKNRK